MGDIMSGNGYAFGVRMGAVAVTALIVGTGTLYHNKKLKTDIQRAAPEIVSNEVKKLDDLCKDLASRGVDCSKLTANFKPPCPL
jgi:hypothetical protein